MANKFDKYIYDTEPSVPSSEGKSRGNRFDKYVAKPPAAITDRPGRDPEDPLWQRSLRKVNDVMRAASNSASFGLRDKFAEATGLEENAAAMSAEAREATPYGSVAGDVMGMMVPAGLMSSGVKATAKAIPATRALARNTIPAIMGREAIAAGGVTTADNAIREGEFHPVETAMSMAAGGVLAGGIAGASRVFSPGARVRGYGADLTDADRAAAYAFARSAQHQGIPLNAAEAVAETVPSRSASVERGYKYNTQLRAGNEAGVNFHRGRTPAIEAAGRRVKDAVGPGIAPAEASKAAGGAIKYAKDLVRQSADPYYKQAGPTTVAVTPTQTMKDAARQMKPAVRQEIAKGQGRKTPQTNTVAYLDALKKRMDALVRTTEDVDPQYSGIIARDAGDLRQVLDTASPEYSTGRGIAEQGGEMVRNLGDGPLGKIKKSKITQSQGSALFGAKNAVERDLASNAISRMGNEPARGILANTIDTAVSAKPDSFAKTALPTEHSMDLARQVMGPDFDQIADTLAAARAVKPVNVSLFNENAAGPGGKAFDMVRGLGTGKVIDKMNDPEWILRLGVMGKLQRLMQTLGTGTAATAADVSTGGRRH